MACHAPVNLSTPKIPSLSPLEIMKGKMKEPTPAHFSKMIGIQLNYIYLLPYFFMFTCIEGMKDVYVVEHQKIAKLPREYYK